MNLEKYNLLELYQLRKCIDDDIRKRRLERGTEVYDKLDILMARITDRIYIIIES